MSIEIDPRDLMDCLSELEDPRIDRTKKHALIGGSPIYSEFTT